MLKFTETLDLVRFGLLIVGKSGEFSPISQNMLDVPGSLDDCNVNCCDTDVSLSVRLFIL
jgi:hypothetical protein